MVIIKQIIIQDDYMQNATLVSIDIYSPVYKMYADRYSAEKKLS